MGLRNHLEDGTGHILNLGLDLDYLHVEGAERQTGLSTASAENLAVQVGAGPLCNSSIGSSSASFSTHSSFSSSSSCFSEEIVISDSEDERLQNSSGSESQHPDQDQPHRHNQESSTYCEPGRLDLAPNQSSRDPSQPETSPHIEPATDCRAKVEFARKLGYSEELVLLVLRKLGPDALINDILGELVKLGTKTEMEQQRGGGRGGPQSPASSLSSSLTCSSSISFSTSPLGSCRLLCPSKSPEDKENLRPVVVDGSNVAMSHGNKEVFSCQGIQLAVDWFWERGHRDVTVFVPAWRKEQSRPDALITDQEILGRLEKEKILVFTPSRRVQGRRVVCYDDRFIVKLAYESDGIIVSNDNYRDLANEKPEWKKFIDERLLMYSFVNDKFMPPDDPLGRHGPSLENFLRKRPVIPEHRKQPCPYGKKCTYGHKCKFYHPERGSQPQRAVADELRASAKISLVASKGQLEDALMAKGQISGESERAAETKPSWAIPKKQPNSSFQSSFTEPMDNRLWVQSKVEASRGSTSNSSSSCTRSFLGHPVPGEPHSSGSLDLCEQPGGSGGSSVRASGASRPSQAEIYHRCESPVSGYNSLAKAYSSLSLVVPQTPECFFPADLRARSLPSDCSSEGSVSSDSFSPDLVLDDSPKCNHHHHHSHPSHHCPGQYVQSARCNPPGLGQHSPPGYPPPQVHRRQHGFGVEDPPSSLTSHALPHPFKPSSVYSPPHLQQSMWSSFPRAFPAPTLHSPQKSTAHPHSQSSFLGQNLISSLWQEGGFQDKRIYEGSSHHSRGNFSKLNQQPQYQIKLDPHCHQTSKHCYDLFAFPEVHEKVWHFNWDRQAHSSPRHTSASSLPPPPQFCLSSITNNKTHQSSASQHLDRSSLGQFQDLREKVFVNLCGIFPPDLVRLVMSRNPRVMDAQELAAAILMEKAQHSS